ncbi:MAG: hypothetical protein ACLRWP_20520 [Bilophila wadsworthia]
MLSMSKMATCSSRNLESPFERADRMNSRSGHARTTDSKSHSSSNERLNENRHRYGSPDTASRS